MSIETEECESCNDRRLYFKCDQCGVNIGSTATQGIMVLFGSNSKHVGQRRDYCSDACFGQSLKDMVKKLEEKGKS